MDEPRSDPLRHGGQLLDMKRCPGCRRELAPATMEEWATPLGFATPEQAESLFVFYICKPCFDRTRTETGNDFARRIDATARQWHEMNATLSEYKNASSL
jgi:hypothetical protein